MNEIKGWSMTSRGDKRFKVLPNVASETLHIMVNEETFIFSADQAHELNEQIAYALLTIDKHDEIYETYFGEEEKEVVADDEA